MLGQTIDNRYTVEALLGRGGMGVVYRAVDQVTSQPVALKFLHVYLDSITDTAFKRFQREFRVLAQLDHPRIVRAHGYGAHQDAPYLVLELLDGQTLAQKLAGSNGPLARPDLLLIARQICEALGYLHARSIVHRDLKPGNLMLLPPGDSPQVKLMDFGLVHAADLSQHLTREGVALGTVAYIAPEQAQGIPVDFRADLYALGIILYEMATGRPPFIHDNPAVLLMNQLMLTPPSPRQFNPELDEPLEQLILQLLAKEPCQRPGDTGQLEARLAELASDSPAAIVESSRKRADLIPRVPLIGRESCLTRLAEWWQQVQAGAGQVVLLGGVAGAGKTRLLNEASLRVRLSRQTFLKSNCLEHAALPYQPLVEILEPLVQQLPPAQQAELPAELVGLLPGLDAADAIALSLANPAEAKLRLFAACRDFLHRSAQAQPLMLAIEDVQWIDPTTLELLSYLADGLSQTKILLVLTYRPEEVDGNPALATALRAMQRQTAVQAITLELLSRAQVDQFLQAALGRPQMPDWLVESFYLSTNGNPLFIEETLKAMAQEGRVADWLQRETPQSVVTTVSTQTLQLPRTVLALAERRLQQLSAEDRAMLTMAAILGPEFSFSLLEKVSQQAEDTLLDAIDRLLRARLIQELPLRDGEDRFRFVQEALRQALLNTTSQRRLRRIHQRTGEAIQALYDTGQARYWPILAYHFAEAGDNVQALKYFTLAGDAAAQLYANPEAIGHYSRALDLAKAISAAGGRVSAHQFIHLYTRRGRCYELNTQFPEALENYAEMHTLARRQNNQAMELAALLALATIHSTPTSVRSIEQGLALSQEALRLAQALKDREAEARALWNLCLAYKFANQPAQAVQAGEQSLAIARELNLKEQIAFALNDTAWAYMALGQPDLTRQRLHEATDLWREVGNLAMLADNLASLTSHYFLRGDFEQAQALAEETLQLSQSIDNRWNQVQGWMALGHLHLMRGEAEQAIERLNTAITLSETGGWMMPQVTCRAELAWLYGALGDVDRGITLCRQAQARAGEVLPDWRAYPTAMLAKLHLTNNDLAAAEQAVAEGQAELGERDLTLAVVWLGLAAAELALRQENYSRALQTVDRLLTRLEELKVYTFFHQVLYLKALACQAQGEVEPAYKLLTEAKAMAEGQQSRHSLWRVLEALRQLETGRGETERARTLQRQARETIRFIAAHTPPEQRSSFLALPEVQAVLTPDS